MSSTARTLYLPILSQTTLDREKISPLFDRVIQIYYSDPTTHQTQSVGCSVFEIYKEAQKRLSEVAGECTLVLKGSSVSSLFSKEPVADIDIHAVFDLREKPLEEQLSTQRQLTVSVLNGLKSLIISKTGKTNLLFDHIFFDQRQNRMAQRKQAPFNVYTLTAGSIPVEFSFIAQVEDSIEPLRNFDFNSGVLELFLQEDGTAVLSSRQENLEKTILELESKELTCLAPEGIQRKSIPRYLMKLIVSGYIDKDPDLFFKLFASSTDESLSKVLDEIDLACKDKDISRSAAYLWIWILAKDYGFLSKLLAVCRSRLVDTFSKIDDPQSQCLSQLIKEGNAAEVCWYLFMICQSARFVMHREGKAVQVHLPKYPLLSDEPTSESLHLIIPFNLLERLYKCSDSREFFRLDSIVRHLEISDDESRFELQKLFENCLTLSSVFPIFSLALTKCGIVNNENYSEMFIAWYQNALEAEKEAVPIDIFFKGLEKLDPQKVKSPAVALQIVTRLLQNIPQEQIDHPKYTALHPLILHLSAKVIALQAFSALEPIHKELIINAAKHLLQKEAVFGDKQLRTFCKLAANLYALDSIEIEIISNLMTEALERGLKDVSLKCLKSILSKESKGADQLEKGIELFATKYPKDLLTTLKENPMLAKQLGISWRSIIEAIIDTSIFDQDSDLLAEFLEILPQILSEDDAQRLIDESISSSYFSDEILSSIVEHLCACFDTLPLTKAVDFIISPLKIDFIATLPNFREKIESNPQFCRELLTCCLNTDSHEIASVCFDVLLQTSSEECFSLIRSTAYRRDAEASTLLMITEKLYDLKLLYPEYESTEEFQILTLLICNQLYEKVQEHFLSEMFEAETELVRLQKLYRLCFIDLYSHKLFPLLDSIPLIKSTTREASSWLDLDKLTEQIEKFSCKEHQEMLVASFRFDSSFCLKLIRRVSETPEDKIALSWPLLQAILNVCQYEFSHSFVESIKDQQSLIPLITLFFMNSKCLDLKDETSLTNLLQVLRFCAIYSDQVTRGFILSQMESSVLLTGELSPSNHALLSSIFHVFLEKAVADHNPLEILHIQRLYFLRPFSQRYNPWEFFSSARLNTMCMQWEKLALNTLKEPCDDSEKIELISTYIEYLKNLAISLRSTYRIDEAVCELKDIQDKACAITSLVSRLIRLMSIYNHLPLHQNTCKLLDIIEFMPKECATQIATSLLRFSKQYIEYLKTLEKKDLTVSQFSSVIQITKHIYSLLEIGKFTELDRKSLLDITIALRELIIHFQLVHNESNKLFNFLLFLESRLSAEQTNEYFASFASMVLERQETISSWEVSCFLDYIVRKDEQIAKSDSVLSSHKGYSFLKIDEKFLSQMRILDPILTCYQLLFSKFYLDQSEPFNVVCKDKILRSFGIYMDKVIGAVFLYKGKAQYPFLEAKVLDIFDKALSLGPSRADSVILSNSFRFLVQEKTAGHFALRATTREQLKHSIELFCKFCQKMKSVEMVPISESGLKMHEFIKRNTFLLLSSHTKEIQKAIGKKELAELIAFFSSKTSRK